MGLASCWAVLASEVVFVVSLLLSPSFFIHTVLKMNNVDIKCSLLPKIWDAWHYFFLMLMLCFIVEDAFC